MHIPTIEQRLRLGEDSRTEFKSAARGLEPKILARTIAAFANGRGGQIFVGVEDDGTPTGVGTVQQADGLMLQVVQVCQTRVSPPIWCPITKVEVAGKLILIVEKQLDQAMAFVPNPSRVVGLGREELGLPEAALREALVNALAHRDYRAASQVRLFVFSDRVEVINPGILLNHLTLESIRLAGISVRRNPILASLLARAQRTESVGVGIPEMFAKMRERGLPEPELSVEGGHFRVVLRSAPPGEAT